LTARVALVNLARQIEAIVGGFPGADGAARDAESKVEPLVTYLVFFISGCSALVFEVLWFRQSSLAFGSSIWASTLVLSSFMAGLALGNALAAWRGHRTTRPLRGYALAEVLVGSTGLLLVYLLPAIGALLAPLIQRLGDHVEIVNVVRACAAFALLLVPSTAMGVSLPLVTRAVCERDGRFGSVLGRLYGFNTLGATAGAILGETLLIPRLGIRGAAIASAGLALLAAGVAVWLDTRTRAVARREHAALTPVETAAPTASLGVSWLIAAAVSGFCLLALETVWFRLLLLFVRGDALALAYMLATVLVSIGAGGVFAGWLMHRGRDAHRFASSASFLMAAACVGSYVALPAAIAPFQSQLIGKPLDILRVALPLMAPVCLGSGMLFTLLAAGFRRSTTSDVRAAGVLTLANTIGAATGAAASGTFLVPRFGTERALVIIAAIYAAAGAWLWWRSRTTVRVNYALAVVAIVALALFPFGSLRNALLPITATGWERPTPRVTTSIVAVREGVTETATYLERRLANQPVSYTMLTNAYSMSSTRQASRRYMKLFVYWPLAVHPDSNRSQKALLIAFGVGNTAKALTDSNAFGEIDVVDPSRDILQMSKTVFPEGGNPLDDTRVRVHVEDGRYFLETTAQRFDLITGEPPPPAVAGIVNLYTREYFRLMHNRLAAGGIVTYWLPLTDLTDGGAKAILRAFCDAFEDCSLWNGMGTNLMMVGTRRAAGTVSAADFSGQWTMPVVAAELKRLGLERPEQLGALFIGDAVYVNRLVEGSPALVDDRPAVLRAPAPGEPSELARVIADTAGARSRFSASAFVKRLWPQDLLGESLRYFEFQEMINAHFTADVVGRTSGWDDTHRLLTGSTLSTPVLWNLGSDADIQDAADKVRPRAPGDPFLQLQLGLRLIAERHYAEAIGPLIQAARSGDRQIQAQTVRLVAYSLGLSNRGQDAQEFAREFLASSPGAAGDPFWSWMERTFHLHILAD
jgi:spermidine synthase